MIGSRLIPICDPPIDIPIALGHRPRRVRAVHKPHRVLRDTVSLHEAWLTLITSTPSEVFAQQTRKPGYTLVGLVVHTFNRFDEYSIAWETGLLDRRALGHTHKTSTPGLMTDAELAIVDTLTDLNAILPYADGCARRWRRIAIDAGRHDLNRVIIDADRGPTVFIDLLIAARRHAGHHLRQAIATLEDLKIVVPVPDPVDMIPDLELPEALF
jgi:hypothetical protein